MLRLTCQLSLSHITLQPGSPSLGLSSQLQNSSQPAWGRMVRMPCNSRQLLRRLSLPLLHASMRQAACSCMHSIWLPS